MKLAIILLLYFFASTPQAAWACSYAKPFLLDEGLYILPLIGLCLIAWNGRSLYLARGLNKSQIFIAVRFGLVMLGLSLCLLAGTTAYRGTTPCDDLIELNTAPDTKL